MKRLRMKATEIVVEQEASESSSEDLSFSDILYDGAGEALSDESENEEGGDEESYDSEGGSASDSDADESFDFDLYL